MASKFLEQLSSMKDTSFTRSGTDKEWSEAIFEDKYKNLRVNLKSLELSEQIVIGKAFLNWFVGADMGPNFDLSNLMLKMLGLINSVDHIPLINHLLKNLPSGGKEEASIASGCEGKLDKIDLMKDIAKQTYFSTSGQSIVGSQTGNVMPGTASSNEIIDTQLTTTIENVKLFYTSCWDCLDIDLEKTKTGSYKSNLNKLHDTLNYLFYLGLITSRYAVKTKTSVTSYYARVATKNFNNITESQFVWTTPPPHASSIQQVIQLFTKGSVAMTTFLITELKLYKLALDLNEDNVVSLFTAGNLLHFKFNGMLLINVASKLCLLCKLTLNQLLEASAYSEFETSLLRLISVSNKYISSEAAKTQITFPWCRLIDDKYMAVVSAEPNKALLDLWLTAIADIDNNPDVWALYPWNGNVPQNRGFRIWTENVKRTIEPQDLTPLTTKAKAYKETSNRTLISKDSDRTTNDDDEYTDDI
ncbi:MAG: hypothetical protein [Xiangshan rhabdo-like virus 4]|uniref:Nucleoprotein n=1 Tax=Xiangshan rhabdo-like virus 4 TaxID=2886227 RepID=A0A8K1P3J7_9RHAB|nr:MAG: hypothetical protein [Xiangshan rhabdo-like virus 4]